MRRIGLPSFVSGCLLAALWGGCELSPQPEPPGIRSSGPPPGAVATGGAGGSINTTLDSNRSEDGSSSNTQGAGADAAGSNGGVAADSSIEVGTDGAADDAGDGANPGDKGIPEARDTDAKGDGTSPVGPN